MDAPIAFILFLLHTTRIAGGRDSGLDQQRRGPRHHLLSSAATRTTPLPPVPLLRLRGATAEDHDGLILERTWRRQCLRAAARSASASCLHLSLRSSTRLRGSLPSSPSVHASPPGRIQEIVRIQDIVVARQSGAWALDLHHCRPVSATGVFCISASAAGVTVFAAAFSASSTSGRRPPRPTFPCPPRAPASPHPLRWPAAPLRFSVSMVSITAYTVDGQQHRVCGRLLPSAVGDWRHRPRARLLPFHRRCPASLRPRLASPRTRPVVGVTASLARMHTPVFAS